MRTSRLLIPLFLAMAALCRADSVTLVSGEKVTGVIKEETDSEITIEVPVSASITDERTIKKSEISKMEKDQPDEVAYKGLMQIEPNPQISYAPQTYKSILDVLHDFEAKYPNSPHLADIQKKAAEFEEEKKKVDGGEVKYLGDWLSKDQAASRRIQIIAMQILASMQAKAAAGDFIGAMQTFEILERNYGVTRSYPPAVTLALAVIERLQQQLTGYAQAIVADEAQLKRTIIATPEPEKTNLIAAAKMEQERNEAVVRQAVRSGTKWVPLIPRSQLSISTLQSTASSELSRLRSVPLAAMTRSIALVDAGRQAMGLNDFATADAALKNATQLWPQSEAAQYWTAQLKAKTATPTPTPKPSPKPSPHLSAAPAAARPAAPVGSPVAAAGQQAADERPFLSSPIGMASSGLVVLLLAAWGFSAYQKKKAGTPEIPEA